MFISPRAHGVISMFSAIVYIAATSIAIKAYNDNAGYKNSYKKSFYYLVAVLIMLILSLMYSGYTIYVG